MQYLMTMTGHEIKEARERKNWTINELARAARASWESVKRWEEGTRDVHPRRVLDLATALDLVDDLEPLDTSGDITGWLALEIRCRLGLSQRQLAERMGHGKSWWGDIENERRIIHRGSPDHVRVRALLGEPPVEHSTVDDVLTGADVHALRVRMGITRGELETHIGGSHGLVYGWEVTGHNPSLAYQIKLRALMERRGLDLEGGS